MPRLLILAGVVALSVLSPSPAAQISVGAGGYSLDYTPGGGTAVYTFDSDVYALGFYGPSSLFHAFYGTDVQPASAAGDSTEATALGVDLATAGQITVATLGDDVEVTLFLPLGVEFGYRNLTVEAVGPAGSAGGADAETLHLALAAVRGGGGAAVTVPLTGLPLARALSGSASLTLGAGAQGDFDPIEAGAPLGGAEGGGFTAYGLRTTTLSLQAQLHNVLGGELGVIAGYTFRTSRTADDAIESFADALDVVTQGGDYARFERLHLARVGLVF